MVNKSSQWILSAILVLICASQAWAIKCVVCQNCPEGPFEANHTMECNTNKKKGPIEDRCIKMVLKNEEVDRGCGDASKCAGRVIPPPGKKPRSLTKPKSKPEELTNNAPRQRTIRQLLAPPADKGGEGKNPELDIASMYCCEEDECNSGNIIFNSNFQVIVLTVLAISGFFTQMHVLSHL